MLKTHKAVVSPDLSSALDIRYVIADTETGEIIDDCNGYGYKTKHKAYACAGWKAAREKEQKKDG